MNRLGIQSLNAGAPDLRLTGDQTQRGTYVQRRRNQMAYGGIAGLDGRRQYGIGSWFQEKIKDPIAKLIPNELKNPAALATIAGLGVNQFGLPDWLVPDQIASGSNVGQNWLGELLGNVPGVQGGTVDTVLGKGGGGQSIMDIFRPETISKNPVGGLDQLAKTPSPRAVNNGLSVTKSMAGSMNFSLMGSLIFS